MIFIAIILWCRTQADTGLHHIKTLPWQPCVTTWFMRDFQNVQADHYTRLIIWSPYASSKVMIRHTCNPWANHQDLHQHFIPTPLQPSRWFFPCTHTKQEWFPASFLVPGLWCIWYTRSSSYEGCKRRRAGMHVNKISMRCKPVTKICEPDSKPSTNSSSRAEGCNRTRLVGLTASP